MYKYAHNTVLAILEPNFLRTLKKLCGSLTLVEHINNKTKSLQETRENNINIQIPATWIQQVLLYIIHISFFKK